MRLDARTDHEPGADMTRERAPPARVVLAIALVMWSGTAVAATGSCAPGEQLTLYAPRSFLGYACDEPDCSAHKAGFGWADRLGIADPLECVADGPAGFAQGCRAFADGTVTAEQAGFDWARENEITLACLCAGAGRRFEAGCEVYVLGFGVRVGER